MSKIFSGIDVSTWQGDIDFSKLDKSKVEFALCRSSFGWLPNQKDNSFDRNIKGFQSLGIPCGAYHYSYARNTDEAVKEAKYFLECVKGYKFELPVYYDMEEESIAALGKKTCTAIAKAFCETVKAAGYLVGIYTNPNWLTNHLDYEQLKGYELWLASWGASKPSYPCGIWQYNVGKSGSIAGISGEIDLDYMYKDYASVPDPVPTPVPTVPTDSQVNSSAIVDYTVKVSVSNGLNIRRGAGTSYTVKSVVPCGTVLHITRQTVGGSYTWGYTEYNGITGWVALSYTEQYCNKI